MRDDAGLGRLLEAGTLQALGLLEGVQPYRVDTRLTTESLLNRVPGMTEAAIASTDAPGSFNLGAFLLLFARARLRAHGEPILEVSAPLQALLAETELTAGLPTRFFCCPHPLVSVASARPSPLTIHARASGRHEVDGADVGSDSSPCRPGASAPCGQAAHSWCLKSSQWSAPARSKRIRV